MSERSSAAGSPPRAASPAPSVPAALATAIDEVARVGRLLVSLDFDGTLAPFDVDPARSRMLPDSAAAVRRLAALADTTVALVSGRSLASLAEAAGASQPLVDPGAATPAPPGLPLGVVLVGSHGLEARWADGSLDPVVLSDAEARALRELDARLTRLAEEPGAAGAGGSGATTGAWVERKPASVSLHTRTVADAEVASGLEAAARAAAEGLPGVEILPGKRVVELTVRRGDKGRALDLLRAREHADAVFSIGDDLTDERSFVRLRPDRGDIGVHVGPGPTAAQFRVGTIEQVSAVLARLADSRRTSAPAACPCHA